MVLGRNPYDPIREETGNPGHFHEHTVDELVAAVEAAGLDVDTRPHRELLRPRLAEEPGVQGSRPGTAAEPPRGHHGRGPQAVSEWARRAALVLARPRDVFEALRDDSLESAGDRQDVVVALAFVGGVAAALATASGGALEDLDALEKFVWIFATGFAYGFVGYWVLGWSTVVRGRAARWQWEPSPDAPRARVLARPARSRPAGVADLRSAARPPPGSGRSRCSCSG